MSILIPTRQRQPLQAAQIDARWAGRLAFLVNAGVGSVPYDAIGARFADVNPLSRRGAMHGLGYTNANTSTGARLPGASRLTTSTGDGLGDFTIFVLAAPSASTTRQMAYSNSKAGGAEMYFVFNANVALTATAGSFTLSTNAGGAFGVTATSVVDGKPHVFLITRRSGTIFLYVDGVLKASGAHSGPIWSSGNWDNICGYTSTGWGVPEPLPLVGGMNVGLSDAEASALSSNVWQVYSAQPRQILWATPGASGATGSFTSTLAGATFLANGQITNLGSFASTLDGATFAASGVVGNAPSGSIASTLTGVSMAAAGDVTNTGTFASTLSGASMAASGTVTNRGAMASTLDGAAMSASGSVNANASGSFASTLDGATFAAGGYVGTPPAAPDFFIRLPKNPRHSLRH